MARRHSFGRSVGILLSLAARTLDALIPPRCLGCVTRGAWLCQECAGSLEAMPEHRCRICARPLAGVVQVCADCYRQPPPVDAIHAPFGHTGLARELVHGLKYKRWRHLSGVMADLALPAVPSHVDAVVCVPLHPEREKQRGFNQSRLLADEIARRASKPFLEGALVRTRDTPSQTGLTPDERAANVRGAFAAPRRFEGQRLLLIDDVCTTGATIYACARALRRAAVASTEALVFTRVGERQA